MPAKGAAPMAITSEQRREINRKKASRSTGPKSREGKLKARANALKHGLRAETLALPNEDAEELSLLTDEWLDYYQPASPGMRAMLDRAVYSTVQLRRCQRFQAAAVAEQVRNAEEEWDGAQEQLVESFKAMLKDDPAEAVRGLRRSALGCRWLLQEWNNLSEQLEEDGCWFANSERDQAIRLLSMRPEALKADPEVYLLCFRNLSAREHVSPEVLAWYLDRRNMPEIFHRVMQGNDAPMDREISRQGLRDQVAKEVDHLTGREERLGLNIEEPRRAEAGDRAILLGGEEGKLYARYARMHDAAFHRSFKGLMTGEPFTEQEDEDQTPASFPQPAATRADAGVAVLDLTAARPVAPNEASSIPDFEVAPPMREG